MEIANIHEAKSNLSKVIESVLAGEEVLIAKAGKPLVRLIAYQEEKKPRMPGGWEGQVTVRSVAILMTNCHQKFWSGLWEKRKSEAPSGYSCSPMVAR